MVQTKHNPGASSQTNLKAVQGTLSQSHLAMLGGVSL